MVEVEHSTEALAPMHWLRWRDDGGRAAGVEAPHDAEPRPNGTDARAFPRLACWVGTRSTPPGDERRRRLVAVRRQRPAGGTRIRDLALYGLRAQNRALVSERLFTLTARCPVPISNAYPGVTAARWGTSRVP